MQSTPVLIERTATATDLPLPAYQTEAASGMDVCAAVAEDVVLEPGRIVLVPTGLRMAVAPGYEVQVRPRSGLALKHGVTVVNAPGTIDADYRGEVGVILGNVSQASFTITRGMRIAQLVVQEVVRGVVEEVESLPETVRGSGGFGSSGLH